MPSRPMANFHLPLSPELHEMLREEAERSGQPATAIAREVLEKGLTQRRKWRLHQEIAAWASAHAGTDLDLDRDLEQAGSKLRQRIGSLPEEALRAVEVGLRAAVDLDA